jgi:hypothetical protein
LVPPDTTVGWVVVVVGAAVVVVVPDVLVEVESELTEWAPVEDDVE